MLFSLTMTMTNMSFDENSSIFVNVTKTNESEPCFMMITMTMTKMDQSYDYIEMWHLEHNSDENEPSGTFFCRWRDENSIFFVILFKVAYTISITITIASTRGVFPAIT